jgi:nucleoid-associated protein YgaU
MWSELQETTGLDLTPPTFEKAQIVKLKDDGTDDGDAHVCMYNPENLQFTRSPAFEDKEVSGEENSQKHRKGGGKATLTVKLLYDTTRTMKKATDGVDVTKGDDVRKYIDFLYQLLKEKTDSTTGKQPYCSFRWGKKLYIVKGFLTNLSVTYTLFAPNGTPLRADVNTTFEEQSSLSKLDEVKQNPTSRSEARKTWVVREGERLDYIAYQEYKNPAHWRHIAITNRIEDPFSLRPGQVIKLVPLP